MHFWIILGKIVGSNPLFDSVAIARARARGAQRPPPRSGAFRKFWAHREPMGEISVSGMALGLSTGKTFFVRNLELSM